MGIDVYFGKYLFTVNVPNIIAVWEGLTRELRYPSVREDFYLLCNGLPLTDRVIPKDGQTIHAVPRLLGGKGGFGSMLRAIGAQIEKTTNREACRDLSGRRLRDINEEKRLKKWISQQTERHRATEERRQKKLERLKEGPKHTFHDPAYDKIRSELLDNVYDAVEHGLKNSGNGSRAQKRKSSESDEIPIKRQKGLLFDMEDLSDESDMSDDSDTSNHDVILPAEESNKTEESDSVATSSGKFRVIDDVDDVDDIPVPKKKQKLTEFESIDLDAFVSAASLELLGLEQLKAELMIRGLKCGGDLKQRAERLFAVKGIPPDKIPPELLVKPIKK